MATLGAWPHILPNQAPGEDASDTEWQWEEERGGGHGRRDQEEGKEGGLDKGK